MLITYTFLSIREQYYFILCKKKILFSKIIIYVNIVVKIIVYSRDKLKMSNEICRSIIYLGIVIMIDQRKFMLKSFNIKIHHKDHLNLFSFIHLYTIIMNILCG